MAGGSGTLNNACGMLIWYPRVNHGPSLFYFSGSPTSLPKPGSTKAFPGTAPAATDAWKCGFMSAYNRSFTQTALVSASISI